VKLRPAYDVLVISLSERIVFFLRRVPYRVLKRARDLAKTGGVELSIHDLETHYLCGGDVIELAEAIVIAKRRGLATEWRVWTAIDLAGYDTRHVASISDDPRRVVGGPNSARYRRRPEGMPRRTK
jgi:uncharacterized protein YqfA (UPF0365 family)